MQNYFNYFTEIEQRFQQRRGSLHLLSTLDWALIDTWREAGLPLEVVLRGIDAAFDRYDTRVARAHTRIRRPNSLAWCAPAVLESAEQAADASAAPISSNSSTPADTGFEPTRVSSFLRTNAALLAASTPPPPADAVVAEAAARLTELADAFTTPAPPRLEDLDRTLTTLEEKLVAALRTGTPETDLTALREQADRELAPFRSRMQAVQIRQIHTQFLHKRLLEQHRLPRLSLFYMSLA